MLHGQLAMGPVLRTHGPLPPPAAPLAPPASAPRRTSRRCVPTERRDDVLQADGATERRDVPGANQAAATCVLLGGTHPIGLLRTDILN